MITIEKKYMLHFDNYKWFGNKMDDSFCLPINDGKTKIIFGFNGIGKSSITKCLRENNTENIRFLDYEYSFFKEKQNEISISPFIKDIDSLNSSISLKTSQLDFTTLSKAQGFTKTSARVGPNFMKAFASKAPKKNGEANIFCDDKRYFQFLERNKEITPKIFFDIVKELDAVTEANEELEKYQKTKYRQFLIESKKFVEIENKKCPVCGSSFEDINKIIDEKIASLKTAESNLIKLMEEKGYNHDLNEIEKYSKLCKELKDNDDILNDFIVCGIDSSLHTSLVNIFNSIAQERKQLSSLESERKQKYLEIKKKEDFFRKDVAKYLKISTANIQFDDKKEEIRIILDRDTSKYSTGERHILQFLTDLYSFIGSDSPTLVMDDPASSLDLINMYKIAFEIAKSCSFTNKNLIVFTHSVDLINIINSQRNDYFDIYYIEEYNGKLYCEIIDYKRKISNIANVITIERLRGKTPKIFESLKERENSPSSDENKVYHYDDRECFSKIDPSLSNHYLLNLIESFTSFSKVNFYDDCFEKIKYLLGIRVWLEKKLYDLIPTSESGRKNKFLSEYTIQAKIKVLENKSAYGTDLFAINNIEKETIVSKKVMLNQNSHYYSQVQPFAYAMNISFDDLKAEIEELKKILP